jgi:hypothetical protein
MTDRKVERVARAICAVAGMEHNPDQCRICEGKDWKGSRCTLWPQFAAEAQAAIRAMKGA